MSKDAFRAGSRCLELRSMQRTRYTKAFTLVELLVGLSVTSILLTAVATLAFALNNASMVGGDTAFRQAQVRQATVRITEVVGKCRLICAAPGNDLVVWSTDDNADNQINLNELVYVERGTDRNILQLCRFNSTDNPQVILGDLKLATTKSQFAASHNPSYVPLLPDCDDVQFSLDEEPPRARLLAISFDLAEDDTVHTYQIVTALRCQADHLINSAGDALVDTDDD